MEVLENHHTASDGDRVVATEAAAAPPSANAPGDLLLEVDSSSFVPYYQQIAEQIRTLIRTGKLHEHQTFLSEGEIAARLGISKMPVRQAFQKLRSEGWLVITRGRKPVVGAGQVPWNFQELRGFTEEMRRRGLEPSARVLGMDRRDPDPDTTRALRLQSGEKIYRLERLRYIDQEPAAIVTSNLPARLFPGLENYRFEGSLYHIMESIYNRKLGYAEEVIGAASAGAREAEVLETVPGAPLLSVRETTFDHNKVPVEYSVSLLRGDRYHTFVVSVRRP
jgi:GntR family transcriptional regulator